MKRRNLILALTAVTVLGLAACGGKQTENVQTEAATTQAAEATTEAAASSDGETTAAEAEATEGTNLALLPEDFEEEFFDGLVTDVSGSVATLKADDGTTMTFDIAGAERNDDGFFMEGAFAEITYGKTESGDPIAVDVSVMMDIEQQASIENRDPVLAGTVQLNDINDLEIIDSNGVEHDFDNSMARTVSFNPIKAGDKVYVTYCGSIYNEDEDVDEEKSITKPITIKIVAADAVGSEEAEANYLTGIVDSVDAENGYFGLLTNSVTFEVSVDDEQLANVEEESNVKVYYEGALSGIAVDAIKVEKE